MAKGGMKTKVMAAKTTTASGCAMVISKGSVMHPLGVIDKGAPVTWFAPEIDPQTARKRWIASIKPVGEVWVDEGAAAALAKGKSLLPAGVVDIKGQFSRGDAVVIRNIDGGEIGHGLSGYSGAEADAIKGLKSGEIESVLGYIGSVALIHRNDMAD